MDKKTLDALGPTVSTEKTPIAFGGFLPVITLGQFAAKVAGGAIWSVIIIQFESLKNHKKNEAI